MTAEMPERVERAFETHDAFERDGTGFAVRTSAFGGRVEAEPTDDGAVRYTLEVRAPMLGAAVESEVGPAVEAGWFETYARRLEDAAMATRADVDPAVTVTEEGRKAVAEFVYEFGHAERGPEVTKTIAEYVEGTYVEGVVPGYEYGPPVADLVGSARGTGEDGGAGSTPL